MDPRVISYTWIALVIYICGVLYLGYLGAKRTTSLMDFAIGGARLGPYLVGLSFAGTFFSAATFVGYVGWANAWGFCALWVFLAIFLGSTLGLLTFARKVRESNIRLKSRSLPDWLGDFYGSDFIRIGTGIVLFFNLFYVAAQLSAGAIMFETLIGLPYKTGLLLTTVLVTAYVFAGGTLADVYTDALQAVLMVTMGVVIFLSGFALPVKGGLFQELTRVISQGGPELVSVFNPKSGHFYALSSVIGVFVIEYAFAAQPQLFNKVLAVKRAADLRRMILTYLVCAFLMMLVIFGGFYARVAGIVPKAPDHTIYQYVAKMFPPAISAILAMVILSAALSTTDGLIVVLATLIGNDIFAKFLVPRRIIRMTPEQADRVGLMLSRVATACVGVVAALLVIKPPPFLGTFIWFGISGVAAGTLGPLLVGIFMPDKVTANGAACSVVTGVVAYLVILLLQLEKSVMAAGAWATLVGIAVMLIATLLRPKTESGHKAS